MRGLGWVRSRSTADKVLLGLVAGSVAVAGVRLLLVVATVPYAYWVGARAEGDASAAGAKPPTIRITERVARSGPFTSWWSERRVPYREGGDYFGVLAQHAAARTLGCVIGVVAERDRAAGVAFERVLVPTDVEALYGEESGTRMTRADGTEFRSYWASPTREASWFTDVLVERSPYDPVLSSEESARLDDAGVKLVKRSKSFFVADAPEGASGQWILFVRPGEVREYLLLPFELSPQAGPR